MQCGHLITVRKLYDLRDLSAKMQLHTGIFCDLFQKIIPQDMGIIGVFLREKSTVTQPRLKIFLHRKCLAGDPAVLTEFQKFRRIRPGKMGGSSVDLLK